MYVHHTKNYQCSLLRLLLRYVHHMKNYHDNLLTLVTHENILMGREERLRRKRDKFNG